MAPDAPVPVYDSHGNEVTAWDVRVEYMPNVDKLCVAWRQQAGPYHKAKNRTEFWDPNDFEDALTAVQHIVRVFSARRLF